MKNKYYLRKFLLVLFVCLVSFSCKKESKLSVEDKISKPEVISFNMKDGSMVKLAKVGNDTLLGGDIVLSQSQIAYIKNNTKEVKQRVASTYVDDFNKLWPGGTVYYKINDPSNQTAILNAISHWGSKTSLQFVQRTNQANYINFSSNRPPTGIAGTSMLGMVGGAQELKLENGVAFGTVVHEIGHAVGLLHEQTRSDRDTYIDINYNNIQSDYASQYDKYSPYLTGFEFGPFDYTSVMMYASYYGTPIAYPGNTSWQITRKDGVNGGYITDYRYLSPVGLSTGDVNGINYMYFPANLYAKLRLVPVGTEIDNTYQQYREFEVYVDFFENSAGTVSKNLDIPLKLNIAEDQQDYSDYSNVPVVTRYTTMFNLVPGSHTYKLYNNVVWTNLYFTYDGTATPGSYSHSMVAAGGFGYKPTGVY